MTPKLHLEPFASGADGNVRIPGSKSLTNRALLLAALADGKSVLRGGLESDDSEVMQDALRKLGIAIEKDQDRWHVRGTNTQFRRGDFELFLGNAGTAMRFLTAASGLVEGNVRLYGKPRMHERPIGDLLSALRQLGVVIRSEANNDCPPLVTEGSGEIAGGTCEVSGAISSQFLSAILLVGACMENGVRLKITPPLVSEPYLRMTIELLKAFEVRTEEVAELTYSVARQRIAPVDLQIEGDASAAAHVFALAVAAQGAITITNFPAESMQGDAAFLDVLERFGAQVQSSASDMTVSMQNEPRPLGEIDLEHIPDAALSAVVLAALAKGSSRIKGLSTLRHKECDRIEALAQNLTRCGATVTTGTDWIEVDGDPHALHGAEIETFDDHRIAMSFAALGTVYPGITILEPECVAKTFPDFWEVFEMCRK